MKTFESFDALEAAVGTEVAITDWLQITQERVDRFADATDDHQWIHVDAERAARGPFGAPIAHGFLTLSLLSKWLGESVHVAGVRMSVNYGTNRVRFTAPVPVGSRVRARLQLQSLERIAPNGVHLCWHATVEIEGQSKPACVAEMLVRHYA
ncbi:putative enoyl-CoA hydratase 1 [Tepidimonas fonticaldi]|uniref:Dehydratase n=1 Tax=Tepidimonas fonticaldi TaxID=1101373 RepID=A0A1A6DTF1_9BURK|nr:MaoC family dehydratase [Tepidimonas fonticaldi]MCX7663771.1 MaoC family dehydratase [Tepidimonas fonticaldi]OBS30054.1 dehydratase [Tepidimonas fonticaldi]TSE35101.1 putative enoyl-CoA hydratase 1 [Tepidimonas fonticaldi]